MSASRIFTKFNDDVERYLQSKLPEGTPVCDIQDISAFVAYKAVIMVNDILREQEMRSHGYSRPETHDKLVNLAKKYLGDSKGGTE